MASPRLRWTVLALLAALYSTATPARGASKTLTLSSAAFAPDTQIPAQHSCDGADQSPPLSWSGAPDGTKSFAVIVDDPDAPVGTWVHWVVYDIPPDATQLLSGVPKDETLSNGAAQGVNDFRKVGYNGPCPPPGRPHRYIFKLYALDRPTGLKPRTTKPEVLRAIDGHILAHTELIGTYKH